MTSAPFICELTLKPRPASLSLDWPKTPFQGSGEVQLKSVRPESSTHRPQVDVRLLAHTHGLRVQFRVEDRYIIVRERGVQGMVCKDSCVEVFLKPPGVSGYVNVECNALGNLHVSWIRNPKRVPGGYEDFEMCSPAEVASLSCITTMDEVVDPEDPAPCIWGLTVDIPWLLFQRMGLSSPVGTWGMNLFKCADESSHPHWISWSPCRELNFHAPEDFGKLVIRESIFPKI